MSRDTRTYIKLHDGMPEHGKVDGLSDKAFRTLIDLWCWCARGLTDGVVPAGTWQKRAIPKVRAELTAAGFVEAIDGGIYMHDYLEHQRSADEVRALQKARAEAGAKGGRAAKAVAVAQALATANAQANEQQIDSKSAAETEELLRNSQTNTETDMSAMADATHAEVTPIRQDVERLCTLLADRIQTNDPDHKRPKVGKGWRDSGRLLIDVDKRSEPQITAAIEWCQAHEFWRGVVLSMPKLREKYAQMQLQAKRVKQTPAGISPGRFVEQ